MARTEVFLTSLFSASCWPEPHRLLPGFDSDAASRLKSGLPRGRSMTSLTPATRLPPPPPGLAPTQHILVPGPLSTRSLCPDIPRGCLFLPCFLPAYNLPKSLRRPPNYLSPPSLVSPFVQLCSHLFVVYLLLSAFAPTGMGTPADGTLSGFPVCPQRLVQSGGSGKGRNVLPLLDSPVLCPRDHRQGNDPHPHPEASVVSEGLKAPRGK